MAVITLGSPSFDPTPLSSSVTTVNSPAIDVVNGGSMTAMVGEVDPVFTAWDRHTGITIHPSQIIADVADIVPLGLALSSQGLTIGTQSAYVVLTWTAIVSSTFDHYHVRYKRNAFSAYSYVDSNTNTISIEGLVANTLYNFGVASVNKSGVSSAFSTNIDVTTTADTTLPATVAGVAASAGIQLVVLTWTANSEADIASYNVYRNTTNDSGTSVLIGNVTSTYFVDGGLPDDQIQYYWLKGKDTSGNISAAYSTVASATPRDVLGIDTLGGLITANLLNVAAINPVDGEINANKIGTLQLDNNAVEEANILAGAITAAKTSLAAINATTGNLNANTVGTTQIVAEAVTSALIANDAIAANHLATDSVTGPAIQAGSIVAAKIGAGEVTATHITTGALFARHITSANFIVSEGTFTDASPGATQVAWASCKVVYEGVEYTITDSNCDIGDTHIYWEVASPTVFLHAAALPTLTNDGFLVAFNDAGTHLLVWNSTIINGNRITTGSIAATAIVSNSITATQIASNAITAIKIQAGAITANKIKSFNFILNSTSDGATWTNNTPAGCVSWSGVEVTYDGVTYPINDGACDAGDVYIYWPNAASAFSHSPTRPALSPGDFIVGTNGNTVEPAGTMVFLTAGTFIDGNTISTGSITAGLIAVGTITADKIGALEITSAQIAANAITADKILAGEIEASHLSVTASAVFVAAEGGSYNSALAGARIKIFPDANTGIEALDAGSNTVFKITVGGTDVGDVVIGNYPTNGILYDKSADTTYFKGNITATTGTIGAWNIDADSMYSGTKKVGDGYSAGMGSITIKSDGSIHAANFYIDADGEASITGLVQGLLEKVVVLGDWDMNADMTYGGTDLTWVALGLSDQTDVRRVECVIRRDLGSGGQWYPLNYAFDPTGADTGIAGFVSYDTTGIVLKRMPNGFFDSTEFDDTSYYRGHVIIDYIP